MTGKEEGRRALVTGASNRLSLAVTLAEAGLPGSIINVSSQMGAVGGPKRTVCCTTEHALEGATRAMAWQLDTHSIRVNTTPMTTGMLADEDFRRFVTSKIALGPIGRIEDVIGVVVYLASDLSTLVTESALMIDTGWTSA